MKSEYSAEESTQSQCLRVFVFLRVKIIIDHLTKSSSADAEGLHCCYFKYEQNVKSLEKTRLRTKLDVNENKTDISELSNMWAGGALF